MANIVKRNQKVPLFKNEFGRRGLHLATHEAYSVKKGYLAGGLSGRTRVGRQAKQLEGLFAEHLGFKCLGDAPVTLVIKVRLLIANLLFLSIFQPKADSLTAGREIRGCENLISRILSELGLERRARPISRVEDYLKLMDGGN